MSSRCCNSPPLHPSHNYSVQFDSPWRQGGEIWSIDILIKEGLLYQEKANLNQLFDLGKGSDHVHTPCTYLNVPLWGDGGCGRLIRVR